MREACSLVRSVLVLLFRSRASLEAEILILRHQLNIQRRHLPKRLTLGGMDRLVFVGLYRLVPSTLNALTIVKPETVIRWHRAGFRLYWRWKSRRCCGRPTVSLEIRRLIREMSSVRRADDLISAALWVADHGPRPAADPVVWGHRASDGRMDRQSAHSGLWLGANPSLPD